MMTYDLQHYIHMVEARRNPDQNPRLNAVEFLRRAKIKTY
jgi:hypothetical protein